MFVNGWKWETRKIMIASSSLLFYELLVSVKENTDNKWKKEETKKKMRIDDKPNWMLPDSRQIDLTRKFL